MRHPFTQIVNAYVKFLKTFCAASFLPVHHQLLFILAASLHLIKPKTSLICFLQQNVHQMYLMTKGQIIQQLFSKCKSHCITKDILVLIIVSIMFNLG